MPQEVTSEQLKSLMNQFVQGVRNSGDAESVAAYTDPVRAAEFFDERVWPVIKDSANPDDKVDLRERWLLSAYFDPNMGDIDYMNRRVEFSTDENLKFAHPSYLSAIARLTSPSERYRVANFAQSTDGIATTGEGPSFRDNVGTRLNSLVTGAGQLLAESGDFAARTALKLSTEDGALQDAYLNAYNEEFSLARAGNKHFGSHIALTNYLNDVTPYGGGQMVADLFVEYAATAGFALAVSKAARVVPALGRFLEARNITRAGRKGTSALSQIRKLASQGTISGAVFGALEPTTQPEDRVTNTLGGAAAGAAGSIILGGLGRVAGRAAGTRTRAAKNVLVQNTAEDTLERTERGLFSDTTVVQPTTVRGVASRLAKDSVEQLTAIPGQQAPRKAMGVRDSLKAALKKAKLLVSDIYDNKLGPTEDAAELEALRIMHGGRPDAVPVGGAADDAGTAVARTRGRAGELGPGTDVGPVQSGPRTINVEGRSTTTRQAYEPELGSRDWDMNGLDNFNNEIDYIVENYGPDVITPTQSPGTGPEARNVRTLGDLLGWIMDSSPVARSGLGGQKMFVRDVNGRNLRAFVGFREAREITQMLNRIADQTDDPRVLSATLRLRDAMLRDYGAETNKLIQAAGGDATLTQALTKVRPILSEARTAYAKNIGPLHDLANANTVINDVLRTVRNGGRADQQVVQAMKELATSLSNGKPEVVEVALDTVERLQPGFRKAVAREVVNGVLERTPRSFRAKIPETATADEFLTETLNYGEAAKALDSLVSDPQLKIFLPSEVRQRASVFADAFRVIDLENQHIGGKGGTAIKTKLEGREARFNKGGLGLFGLRVDLPINARTLDAALFGPTGENTAKALSELQSKTQGGAELRNVAGATMRSLSNVFEELSAVHPASRTAESLEQSAVMERRDQLRKDLKTAPHGGQALLDLLTF